MNKKYLSWNDVENLTDKLIDQLDVSKYDSVFGLPRGGLIPAVMISHKMGLPLEVNYFLSEKCLVVDVYDSGKTLQPYLNQKYDCATLVGKINSQNNLYVGKKVDEWIIFPWETEKSSKVAYLKNG